MSVKNKTSLKSAKVWQRHALAQACFLVATGASTAAFAIDYTPGAAFSVTNATLTPGVAQGYDTYWSTGYNAQNRNYQFGAGQVDGSLPTNVFFSSLTGAGSTPVNINSNSLMLYSYGNQNAGAGLSLANLAQVSSSNDGQLALNLQLFTGLAIDDTVDSLGTKAVLAAVTDTGPYITQVGKATADLSLSGNTVGSALSLNTVDTTVAGATPFGYTSTTKGNSIVTYGDTSNSGSPLSGGDAPISIRGTTGSVNLSNMQNTFNAYGTANVDTAAAAVTVSQTDGVALASFSSNVNLNANTIIAANTSNAAANVFEATAGSSAYTGSVAVTNIQTTKITSDVSATQTANVANGNVQATLQNTAGETLLTGTLNVNGNAVTAKAMGNTAGARTSLGTIVAGNAILFDGNADITGTTGPSALGASGAGHLSNISSQSTQATADLLINSVQRNAGNKFLAAVDSSSISTQVDNLNGGRINQNGNIQSASASANLAGNLISAGPSASIGNISANAAIVNTQANIGEEDVPTVTANVQNSSQSVTVGVAGISATSTGVVSVNDNSITATAEGNAATSTLSLKAGNLNVGGNGSGIVNLVPSATGTDFVAQSGLAASVLSSQKNDAFNLTSNNEGNSVNVQFNTQEVSPTALGITASQVSVSGNSLLSTATGNSATNAVTLAAGNATGLNAGLGNSQYSTNGSTITANAGFASVLSVGITADTVAASQLNLNSNNFSAAAKGNSASNNMTVTATNASGQAQVASGLFDSRKPFTESMDANGANGVTVNADFALANAQADNASNVKAVLDAKSKIVTDAVSAESTLSVNSNTLTAAASVNTGSNAVNLSIANMSGMVAGLSSSQAALDSMATASVAGEVSLTTGTILGASNLAVNTNTVSATVSANTVTNTMALTATNASGRGTYLTYDPDAEESIDAVTATIGSGKAYVNADFALTNVQKTASSSNFVAGTVSGIKAVTDDVTASSITVNANNTLASATANNASNSISLSAGQLTNPNTGLTSLQTMETAAFKATVNDAVNTMGTGVIAGVASAAQIAVTNNVVKASALGNVANNSVDMTGTNATGSTLAYSPALISSDVASAAASSPTNVALVSVQTSLGNELSAKLGDSGTLPKVGLITGNVEAASALSLTDNSFSTQVFNNSANNTLALNVTNLNSMTAGLASGQSVQAVMLGEDYTPLTAITEGQVKLTSGDVVGSSSLTASRNGLKSQVIGNSAGNILSVTATNASGKNSDALGEQAADATNRSASTDFALVSEQFVNASVMSATTHGYVQIASNTVTASALSVNDNNLTAYASANNASNQLALATTNLTAARAGLANMQLLQGNAEVGGTISDSRVDVQAAGNLNGAQVSVAGNTVKATALGNVSINQLSVTGSNATAGSVSLDGSYSQAGSNTYVGAGLALASRQESLGTLVSANNGSASNPTYVQLTAYNVSNASALTLSNNSAGALTYVNNAANVLNVAVTNVNGMTAGLANGQYATGDGEKAIAETVGEISASLGNVVGASTLTMVGNELTASSNVNYAVNVLQATSGQITGRNAITPSVAAYGASQTEVNADLSVANQQKMAYSGEFVRASVTGTVKSDSDNLTSSTANVNGNTVSAYGSGNNATNALAVSTTGLNTASLGLGSSQAVTNSANIKTDANGEISVVASTLNGATQSLNSNQIKSTSVGNVVSNALSVNASNASGASANPGPSVTVGNSSDPVTSTYADWNLANSQLVADGSTLEAKSGVIGGTAVTVGQLLGDVTNGSAVTLNSNALTATAYANSATNASTARVTNLTSMSIGLGNTQVVMQSAPTRANTNGLVSSEVLQIANSSLSVNNNQIAATALANTATNTLDVTSTNASGRQQNAAIDLAANSVAADFSLANAQTAIYGSTTLAQTNGNVQIITDGEQVTNSMVNINNNAVTAYASANQAVNGLTLAVTNLSNATVGLGSQQNVDSGADVTALTTGGVSASMGLVSNNAAVSANANAVKATALGNSSTNQLSVSGTLARADSSVGSTAVNQTSTTADFSLANMQQVVFGSSVSATISADGLTESPLQIALSAADVNTGAALALNQNTISSLSYANSASSQLNLSVGQLIGTSAAVLNNQVVDSGPSQANTKGQVALTATAVGIGGGASLAANNNNVSASTYSNSANNALGVTATNASGRSIDPTMDLSVPSIKADFALLNAQTNGSGSFVSAETTGQVQMLLDPPLTGASVKDSQVSLNTNTISSYARANQAGNEIAVAVTNLNAATTGLASVQMATSGTLSAGTAGQVTLSAGDVVNSSLNVNANTVKATALTNEATNQISLTGTNASSNSSLASPSVNLTSASADVALANQQTAINGFSATAITSANGTTTAAPAVVELNAGTANTNASLSLNTNAITALSYANAAGNQVTLGVSNVVGMSAAVLNNQLATNGAESKASTHGQVSMTANAVDTASLTVNNNTVAASAYGNSGANTLAAMAINFTGRSANPAIALSVPSIQADFALSNVQETSNGANVKAETLGQVQMLLSPPESGVSVQDSLVAVNGNTVAAYASGNQAGNEIVLNVTNLNSATAGLSSVQTASSVNNVKALTGGNLTLSAGEIANSPLTVNGNTVKATALTNEVTNQISLTATNIANSSSLVTPSANLTSTSADVALANKQTTTSSAGATAITSADGTTPAAPEVASPYVIEMVVGAANTNASLSVNNNAITSSAYANSASSTAALDVINLTAINAAVINSQTGTNGAGVVSATSGKTWMSVGGDVDTASLSVNENNVSASSYRNSANNTLTVASTNASGRGVAARETLASSSLTLKNDYAVGNAQLGDNSSTSLARASGAVELFADDKTVTGSTLSLDTNTISAYASGNAADNQLGLAVTQLSQASAGVASYQASATGATVTSEVVGAVVMTAGALDSATLSVKDNTIKSTALGNLVNNALTVSGSAVSSTGSGDVGSAATSSSASVKADFGLSNVQLGSAAVTAQATGAVKISTDSTTGSVTDSNLSLTGNAVKSLAQVNSAVNDLSITSTQQNGITAGLVSSQDSSAAVTATTSPTASAFGISTAGLDNAKVVVSGNTASAVAGKNEAFNTLTVSGANILGRGNNVTGSVAGTSSVTGADFAVINAQSASGAASATVDAGASGFVSSAGLTGGSVTLSGNVVLASANANTSGNLLNLAATNSLEASGVVNNVQSLAAASTVTATVSSSSALSVETDSAAGSAGNATVAVTGNVVKAAASANVAANVLNASGSNGIAGTGAVTSPSGTTNTPTFAVLNSQHTGSGSAVTSVINGFNMGGAQLNGALNSGGSASVTGNVVQSVAYGNSASNAIQVAALPAGLNTASASITNVQYNLSSVTSTISGVNVQGSGVNSSGNGGVNISGNSVVAMAAGNRVVNTITGR